MDLKLIKQAVDIKLSIRKYVNAINGPTPLYIIAKAVDMY